MQVWKLCLPKNSWEATGQCVPPPLVSKHRGETLDAGKGGHYWRMTGRIPGWECAPSQENKRILTWAGRLRTTEELNSDLTGLNGGNLNWETFYRIESARTLFWGSKKTRQMKNKAIINSREEKRLQDTQKKRNTGCLVLSRWTAWFLVSGSWVLHTGCRDYLKIKSLGRLGGSVS